MFYIITSTVVTPVITPMIGISMTASEEDEPVSGGKIAVCVIDVLTVSY